MPRPVNFEEMISISEKLGEELDFVRVDLYKVDGNVYFGEFTIYPASDLGPCDPRDFDWELGSCRKLKIELFRRKIIF